jgi:butyryl-CoA dehydrogenase
MATDTAVLTANIPRCSFVTDHRAGNEVFTIEDYTDEHKLILQTIDEFGHNEIVPAGGSIEETFDGPLAKERKVVAQAKKLVHFTIGQALEKYGSKTIFETQEAVAAIADMMMRIYAMDSAVIRAEKIAKQFGAGKAALAVAMARVAFTQAVDDICAISRRIVAAAAEGEKLATLLTYYEKLTKYVPFDTIQARQLITQRLVENGKYTVGV